MIKKRILVILHTYLPGFRSGGPIRSIEGLILQLKDSLDFYVYTSDRDLGDSRTYPGIRCNEWLARDGYQVYYEKGRTFLPRLARIIRGIDPHSVYLNSLFDYRYSIRIAALKRLGLLKCRLVLAPRGELSPAALSLKKTKKRLFLAMAGLLDLYREIHWHASTETEKKEILDHFGTTAVWIALDLSRPASSPAWPVHRAKAGDGLELVFLSRICRIKNLGFALEVLSQCNFSTLFHIYGPIEDETYWLECQRRMATMPGNIQVQYRGAIAHNDVPAMLAAYDFLFLPTLGESYGHVVMESLLAGTPVIISDRTPWKQLEPDGAGFMVRGFGHSDYLDVLARAFAMDGSTYDRMSRKAQGYGHLALSDRKDIHDTMALFTV